MHILASRPIISYLGTAAGIVAVCLVLLSAAAFGQDRPAAAGLAPKTPGTPCQQFGVNLSGGEFGSALPGTYGVDYIYPGIDAEGFANAWELDYFHGKGLNLIRVPLQWERLQHDLNGPLSDFDLGLIDQVIANAAARGMSVILGPHNFARRTIGGVDYVIGSPQVPYSAFTDFWHRMAAHFAGRPGVFAYALDNEPHDTGGLWVTAGAQAGVDGVRMADMQTPILVPGDGWSGAWTWLESGNDALKTLNDPANKLMFEAHQYFDSDGSGAYALSYDQQGAYPTIGVDRLQEFVNWLHTNNLKGVVDEYGVPDNDARWLTVLGNALAYLEQNSDVVAGGDDWSAGPWWGDAYPLSVEPTGTWPNVTDRPQMSVLQAHTGGCGPGPSPTPAACSIQFSDVPAGSTFYTYVHCLACRGIISGYGDGTFRPGNSVTRGQLAKIVSNSAGYSENYTTATFADVPVGSTFHQFVERLYSRRIVGGYSCGGTGEPCPGLYFRPSAAVTRGQTSKIVAIAKGLPAPPPGQQTFQDVPSGSTFWSWIEELAASGAIQGYPCGGASEPCVPTANRPYFRPVANVTRGQISKIVVNTFFPNCQAP
jgi:endoglucanase